MIDIISLAAEFNLHYNETMSMHPRLELINNWRYKVSSQAECGPPSQDNVFTNAADFSPIEVKHAYWALTRSYGCDSIVGLFAILLKDLIDRGVELVIEDKRISNVFIVNKYVLWSLTVKEPR
jgi:hypothetical protein